ncbi:hypothetical protein C8R43DRAFT_1118276 [Mycena crocata]|nr:hypothetical protein C8R43DRAFT_1118276 [Mycena crocata]
MDVQQKYYTNHASELPDRPYDFSASSWSSMKLGHHAQQKYYTVAGITPRNYQPDLMISLLVIGAA